jgi:glycogen phosphorylase
MTHPIRLFLPTEPEGIEDLLELALDLRWSWVHTEDELWAQLDPELWALTHNPWVVLQTVSRTKLQALLTDPAFRRQVDTLVHAQRQYLQTPAWFQQAHAHAPLSCVAYLS